MFPALNKLLSEYPFQNPLLEKSVGLTPKQTLTCAYIVIWTYIDFLYMASWEITY
jgi:hypothetical protein